ncbi:AraC family transcriptional regulator [Rubellicoccus peritrichatus]|uniref:AraC family transcriptional regulator n=1 Tax=Rubellicoccus peritrichatus TaxID=3080537 RepID=A0AAQ3LCP0_9BACT|nr:AraC family transcriptional regulator [Puniceicoccus sp. CR14]WOO43619.1 AraC family transcriptional regulator [Puniceicoccus sp. CR14]
MYKLSAHDWPKSYTCTYEAHSYTYTEAPQTHCQDYCEFFWVESGRGCHLINNQRRLMETGYFALIRADDQHGFSGWDTHDRVSLINFAFPTDLWYEMRDSFFPQGLCFFDQSDIRMREYQLDVDDRKRLRLMGIDLAAGRWNQVNAAAYLHAVLALLANRKRELENDDTIPAWLTRATRSIETWPNFVGGVPEFVRIAGRSHEHVSRNCRHLMQTTPRDIVNQARIKWASMQLEISQKEIIEIAQECGFENLGHFYKLFKAHHQMTPRKYRLKYGVKAV